MRARNPLTRYLRWSIPALLLAVAAPAAYPQTGEDRVLDDAAKKQIVDTVLQAYEAHYVYPELAQKMSAHVRKQWKRGEYRSLATLGDLTERLQRDLRAVSDDRHLWVEVLEPGELEPAIGEEAPDELIAQRARQNFGFTRVELLAGNVGYLELDRFDDAAWAGETAAIAMNFLANSDAVIIDLRDNHGGYDTMVRLVSSYFYPEPRLLHTMYFTETDSVEQCWTGYAPGRSLADKDLYILTSSSTASGAEAFSYSMKHHGRATVVGEKTRGAAHWTEDFDFPDIHVRLSIPIARPVHPVTGTSWERTGVAPDIEASYERALPVAHLEALSRLAKNCTDPKRRNELEWGLADARARVNPVVLTADELHEYTGRYGDDKFAILVNDGVLYWRDDEGDCALAPLARDLFAFKEIPHYRIAILRGDGGRVTGYRFLTPDGRPHPVRARSGDMD